MVRKLDFKAFIFDLDGCIYRGERLIEGAASVIDALKAKGRKVLYLTNNSTRTPQEYAEKLRRMGIKTSPEEVLTSAIATAIYMRGFERGGCYLIGESALKSAIAREGFTLLEEEGARRAMYLVCGLDSGVTYRKLAAACYAIQGGAKFIATNTDPNLPVEGGYLPGAGAIIGAITAATGAKPFVVGKPSKSIIEIALQRLGVSNKDAVIVGDCLEIDIEAGRNAGVYTILVLTGTTCRADLRGKCNLPDLTIESVKDLLDLI